MSTLMMATKDSRFVTREQAFDKSLVPAITKTYMPISNMEMILTLQDIAKQHGLELKNEQLGLASKDMQMFGTYEIEGKDFFQNRIKMMLGICNSYNGSLSARICYGQKIMVCSNLSFSAWSDENGVSGKIGHKHTINVFKSDGLFQRLNRSFSQIDNFQRKQEVFCEKLIDRDLTQDQAYSTIVNSARAGVIGKAKILDVANIWDEQAEYPNNEEEYESFYPAFQRRNSFNLFNAYTERNKQRIERNPVSANLDTLKLTQFFEKEFILN